MDIRAIRDVIAKAATPTSQKDLLTIPGATIPAPNSGDHPAAKISLSDNAFLGRLEKHLHDYRRGEGYRSKDVAIELRQKEFSTGTSLSPADLAAYAGYSSAFRYDNKARFVNGVSEGQETLRRLESAPAHTDGIGSTLAEIYGGGVSGAINPVDSTINTPSPEEE